MLQPRRNSRIGRREDTALLNDSQRSIPSIDPANPSPKAEMSPSLPPSLPPGRSLSHHHATHNITRISCSSSLVSLVAWFWVSWPCIALLAHAPRPLQMACLFRCSPCWWVELSSWYPHQFTSPVFFCGWVCELLRVCMRVCFVEGDVMREWIALVCVLGV